MGAVIYEMAIQLSLLWTKLQSKGTAVSISVMTSPGCHVVVVSEDLRQSMPKLEPRVAVCETSCTEVIKRLNGGRT
jgi:hypothetical protein